MNISVIIERSRRRSLSLSVKRDLTVTVKAPLRMKNDLIDAFVTKNEDWILRRIELQKRINAVKAEYASSSLQGRQARKEALAYLSSRTAYWAEKMGVKPSKIRLSSAEKRYGSCNSKGEIAYSVILMMYPEELMDAVIVHELAHLKQMNHGKAFYAEIKKVMPDYKTRMRCLREYGKGMREEWR